MINALGSLEHPDRVTPDLDLDRRGRGQQRGEEDPVFEDRGGCGLDLAVSGVVADDAAGGAGEGRGESIPVARGEGVLVLNGRS